jgi:hypothetical protein
MNVPPRLRRILNYAVFLSKNLSFSLSSYHILLVINISSTAQPFFSARGLITGR